ncbi:hypothetical protein FRC12_007618 [Ceratobasidium sp. 428]|nr:hypothetical protein FRC12_007618 [Ceratobasidium sp. 428]
MRVIPDSHPNKHNWLGGLGNSYRYRFEHIGNFEDIEKAITCLEEAVLLASSTGRYKLKWLNHLGNSFHIRFGRLGARDDLERAIACFEHALQLAPDDSTSRTESLANLANAQHTRFKQLGDPEDIKKAISSGQQVAQLVPQNHPERPAVLNNLGIFYQALFSHSGKLENIDDAIGFGEQALQLTPDDHPAKPDWLNNLANSYWGLFERIGKLEDLENSIKLLEQARQLTPDHHPDRSRQLECLGTSYLSRFDRLSRLEDINQAIKFHEQAILLTPDNHTYKPRRLNNLGSSYLVRFRFVGDLKDAINAIDCQEQAVALNPDGHPEKPGSLSNLGNAYYQLFGSTAKLQDLRKSIEYQEKALTLTPEDHPHAPAILIRLGEVYRLLSLSLHDPHYDTKSEECYRRATLMPVSDPTTKLMASKHWAEISSNPLEAYTYSMAILPQVVWLGDPVSRRYECLAKDIGNIVTKAAATAISEGELPLALEWLEQGRSVVWNQTLQLRTPFDDLHAVDSELARDLSDVSFNLQHAALQNSTEVFPDTIYSSVHDIAQRHRRLAETWEELLDRARHIPGFEDFLLPKNASTIISHVRDGVVALVNVDTDRCDALIIQPDAEEIMHVPLPTFTRQKADNARSQLAHHLRSQSLRGFVNGRNSKDNDSLKVILTTLWYDIAKLVVNYLGYHQVLPVENLPHITWCTTGPLSFLPLHAAGDYSDPTSILVNLAISSYTPTISSINHAPSTPDSFSGLLAVGQSSTPGLTPLPGTEVELDRIQAQTKLFKITRLDGDNASIKAVLEAMDSHSWVHLACHASQNLLDPIKSAFHLHDGSLDLTAIARKPLKNAQLAFLSACQTATGDESLPDEAVHLAAGLLMAGYPAIIATMWSISDQYAPLVAETFYKSLLEGGSPDSQRSAQALHKAVCRLREQIGDNEFARWVPYIHIGR